jgi:hypothetical protein
MQEIRLNKMAIHQAKAIKHNTVFMKLMRLDPRCNAFSSLQLTLTFDRAILDECWSVCKPTANTNTAS